MNRRSTLDAIPFVKFKGFIRRIVLHVGVGREGLEHDLTGSGERGDIHDTKLTKTPWELDTCFFHQSFFFCRFLFAFHDFFPLLFVLRTTFPHCGSSFCYWLLARIRLIPWRPRTLFGSCLWIFFFPLSISIALGLALHVLPRLRKYTPSLGSLPSYLGSSTLVYKARCECRDVMARGNVCTSTSTYI